MLLLSMVLSLVIFSICIAEARIQFARHLMKFIPYCIDLLNFVTWSWSRLILLVDLEKGFLAKTQRGALVHWLGHRVELLNILDRHVQLDLLDLIFFLESVRPVLRVAYVFELDLISSVGVISTEPRGIFSKEILA
jgi:hypothetical protein